MHGARPAGFLFLAFLLGGCATLPKDFKANPSHAIPQSTPTFLAHYIESGVKGHPGQSGFLLLDSARDAYVSRISLAELSEKTIDAQYFIWDGDRSGIIL